MRQLRQFLAETVNLQAEFLVQRLRTSLPKILAAAEPSQRTSVQRCFDRVASSGEGRYALVDYVNFKGEGLLATERYRSEGWGLLQVLEETRDNGSDSAAAADFARAAKTVLTRRVANSPGPRHEARWLPGWLNRIETYTRN